MVISGHIWSPEFLSGKEVEADEETAKALCLLSPLQCLRAQTPSDTRLLSRAQTTSYAHSVTS